MKAKGFTLVEILIVVVILGILAAIVIPQFTEASTEAKESRLCTDLQTMRSQLELYKAQHNDNLPDCNSFPEFEDCMTGYTNVSGAVQAGPGANIYGPYMQKIPTNAFNNLNTVTFNAGTTNQAGTNNAGWNLDPATGKFQADDDERCTDGVTWHADL
jgi:general secretion pathway protein G